MIKNRKMTKIDDFPNGYGVFQGVPKLKSFFDVKQILQISWGMTLFGLPLGLSTILWQPILFEQGSYNPYLSFSLYASEILIFWSFFVFGWAVWLGKVRLNFSKKLLLVGVLVFALSLFSLIFSQDRMASLLAHGHLLSALVFGFLLHQKIFSPVNLKLLFCLGIIFQSVLALLQFFSQHSLGLGWLGEPVLASDLLGVAKTKWGDWTLLRPYGTLPHPNVLAGYCLLALVFLFSLKDKKIFRRSRGLWFGGLGVIGSAFLFANSQAALLGALIGLGLFFRSRFWRIWIVLVLCVVLLWGGKMLWKDSQVQDRLFYGRISVEMLIEHPEGVGLGQFTARMEEFTSLKLKPWQFQPVHTIYLLIANQLGVWALGIFLWGFFLLFKKAFHSSNRFLLFALTAFSIIGFFDHYLVSLYPGLVLSVLVFTSPLYFPGSPEIHG